MLEEFYHSSATEAVMEIVVLMLAGELLHVTDCNHRASIHYALPPQAHPYLYGVGSHCGERSDIKTMVEITVTASRKVIATC